MGGRLRDKRNHLIPAMRRITTFAIAFWGLLAGISCGKVPFGEKGLRPLSGVRVEFELSLRNPPSRSSFCPEELDKLSDINVWIYQAGVLLPDYSFYRNLSSGMQIGIVFPSYSDVYDVYFLANAGSVQGPALESEIGQACATFDSYASFREKGFPMAGSVLGFSPSGNGSAVLSRLVGRYDIHAYDNPSNSKVSYSFLSGKMKSCARTIRPFCSDGPGAFASRAQSASEILEDGDALSTDDIATLNAGGTVTLYYLENCQGRLLPDNDTQYGKSSEAVAAATGDASRPQLCSYLELCCRASTPTAEYSSVTYRAYLGKDATSDFSIIRNTVNSLTLDMASNLIHSNGWFVEPDSPVLKRHLDVVNALPYAPAQVILQGWGYSSCPSCGAPWGSDNFHLENNSAARLVPTCSCGWKASYFLNTAERISALDMYPFYIAKVYVISDMELDDTYKVYFKSSGSSVGNGFTLSPATSETHAVKSFKVYDNNPQTRSLTDSPVSDILVVESYDGLIRKEVPITGHTDAIPVGFADLGKTDSGGTPLATAPATVFTPGVRVYIGNNGPTAPSSLPVKLSWKLEALQFASTTPSTTPSTPNRVFDTKVGDDAATYFEQTSTFNSYHDFTLDLTGGNLRSDWTSWTSTAVSGSSSSRVGYVGGILTLTSVSVGKPYVMRGAGYSVVLGLVNDLAAGVHPSPAPSSPIVYNGSLNLPYDRTGGTQYWLNGNTFVRNYRYTSGAETANVKKRYALWLKTVPRYNTTTPTDLRSACSSGSSSFWTYALTGLTTQ